MDESMPQELEFAGTFRMETGERIYLLQDKNVKKQVFYWVDVAGGKCKKMAECTDMTSIRKIYGQCGDDIYYEKSARESSKSLLFDFFVLK